MSTPFPGMDPYLERPNLWPNVHNSLIAAIRDYLTPRLRPRYFVAIQERSYLDDPAGLGFAAVPDASVIGPYPSRSLSPPTAAVVASQPLEVELEMPVRIRETYLEIQEAGADDRVEMTSDDTAANVRVITVLEILSAWYKRGGEGRIEYLHKRRRILNSMTNLVEIDLLRARLEQPEDLVFDYSILVSPSSARPRAHFYAFTVRQAIPAFYLPLQDDDEAPIVELNAILHDLYDRAGYDLRIDYWSDPAPPLDEADARWMDDLLCEKGLRPS